MLLVLRWTENRVRGGSQGCREHYESATATTTTTTAEITQQVTTNGTDSTFYGRDSILASPPRLSVLR